MAQNNESIKVPFIKEALSNVSENSVLVLLNQKQLRPSVNSVITNLIEEKKKVIFVSTTDYTRFFEENSIPKDFFIIDVFPRDDDQKIDKTKIYSVQNPANLTDIQIGIERFSKNISGEVIIFFDSVNTLAIHNSPKSIAKFFYIFINKTSLQGNSLLLFVVKESISEETLGIIKQFCVKMYDYSGVFISSIELAH